MLIDELVPDARREVEAARAELVGDLPSFGMRLTASAAMPILTAWLPRILRIAYKIFLAKFFAMPLGEVLKLFLDDANTLGLDVHPTHYDFLVSQRKPD